jgi:hypothetical protein
MTKRFESFDLTSDSGVFMLDPAEREMLGALADQATEEVDQNARFLELARSLPKVRLDKVMKVREEIAAGTYMTDEKLQATVDRFLRAARGR